MVKRQWADTILSGGKTWEVRGCRTTVRGRIHLAQAGSGTLVGEVRITDCFPVTMATLARRAKEHRITSVRCVVAKYKRMYAWVLADAMRYSSPIAYRHPPGAVTWVRTGDLGCAFRGCRR
jgi:predicted transcriptional regulator